MATAYSRLHSVSDMLPMGMSAVLRQQACFWKLGHVKQLQGYIVPATTGCTAS